MAARDIYHDSAKNALINDGWTITDDPLKLKLGSRQMEVDLGAERLLAAEKKNCQIAVEVKSFVGPSPIKDLRDALGQYTLYADVLDEIKLDRFLYLAIRKVTFLGLFQEPIGQLLLTKKRVRLLVFDPKTEEVVQWIPLIPTAKLS